jgi:transcription elongation factor Elf1
MALKATDILSTVNDTADETAQASVRVLDLPRNNPCAQCGESIALPAWVEAGERRKSYLWHCRMCDYRFETIAFYAEPIDRDDALAA